MDAKAFLGGIISGIAITILATLLLNITIKVEQERSYYINLNQQLPHYEFTNNDARYIEYMKVVYTIKPPFLLFDFNSKQTIKKPENYMLLDKEPAFDDGCISLAEEGDDLVIKATSNQFKYPECKAILTFIRSLTEPELTRVTFNASWKRDKEENGVYEEEGIAIYNKMDEQIMNYVLVYNQTSTSQLQKKLSDCKTIKVFIDNKESDYRQNFFNNASIIAIKFDMEPRENKNVIIRCYY